MYVIKYFYGSEYMKYHIVELRLKDLIQWKGLSQLCTQLKQLRKESLKKSSTNEL